MTGLMRALPLLFFALLLPLAAQPSTLDRDRDPVVMTGLQDARVAADALPAGAARYLFKPFGTPELRSHLSDALARDGLRKLLDTQLRILTDDGLHADSRFSLLDTVG